MASVTIADVAERAGVSKSTVSHVINKTRFVEPETEQRVRQAMQTLRYRPNQLARSLRRQETKIIGLLLPDELSAYWAELSRVIVRAGYADGYTVLLGNSDWSIQHEREFLQTMLAQQLDGILVATLSPDGAVFSEITHAEIPVVLISPRTIVSASVVRVNDRRGSEMAANYLYGLGHRRIGLIGLEPDAQIMDRIHGFRDALARKGSPVPQSAIYAGDFTFQSGEAGAKALIAQHPDLTAIFAVNDNMAIGAIKALGKLGRRVPDDISVIGFDNIMYASAISPELTTIAQPITELGQTAFSLLRECMQGHQCEPKVVTLEPTLIERESCRAI